MSTEVITVTTEDFFLCQEYVTEWRINRLPCMQSKGVQTPAFSPIPNVDVKFCLEIWYQKMNSKVNEKSIVSSLFKVELVKLFAFEIQPALKLEFEITINYSDGTLFKEYKSLSGISVNDMNSITCIEDSVSDILSKSVYFIRKSHGYKMERDDGLILKLRMRFFGPLSTPSVYCHELCSLNNLKKFAKDFSDIWKPSVLSDMIFRIGKKDLPAHRAVLAAHSPVFRKMLQSDFLESKTNRITISDFKYDIFEGFLKYLYSGEIEDKSWSNVRQLYILADKYDVKTLKGKCVEIIGSLLTVAEACEILSFSYDYNDTELKEKAKYFVVMHFQEIVRRKEWYELVTSQPIAVREVMASVYLDPLENVEPVLLCSGSKEILTAKK